MPPDRQHQNRGEIPRGPARKAATGPMLNWHLILEIGSRSLEGLTPSTARRVVARLRDVGRWILKPEVIRCARNDAEGLGPVSIAPADWAEPRPGQTVGVCRVLLVNRDQERAPLLRPCFVLPLQSARGRRPLALVAPRAHWPGRSDHRRAGRGGPGQGTPLGPSARPAQRFRSVRSQHHGDGWAIGMGSTGCRLDPGGRPDRPRSGSLGHRRVGSGAGDGGTSAGSNGSWIWPSSVVHARSSSPRCRKNRRSSGEPARAHCSRYDTFRSA